MRKRLTIFRHLSRLAALMMTISAAVFSFEASAAEYPTPVRIGLSYGTTAADSATLEAQGGFTVNV